MRVESGLVGRKGPDLPTVEKIACGGGNKSAAKKKKRRQKKLPVTQIPETTTAVQRLYGACREVFAGQAPGVVPSTEDVERILSVLDNIKPADVDLTPNLPYFMNASADMGVTLIAYLRLYECDKFSIGIFCLPPSAVIPLHNHPGMTVFSKLLFGSMHIKSYDWVDVRRDSNGSDIPPTSDQPPGLRLAKVKTCSVFTSPCDTSILYPTSGGNMHCFTALTSCAVLDVLGPPYCDSEGRHCTYYNAYPYSEFSGVSNNAPANGEYAWLEEREKPDDFFVLGAKYTGPQIVDQL